MTAAALRAAIDADTRPEVAAAVAAGDNSVLRDLMNELDPTSQGWIPIAGADFLDAISALTLTTEQDARIRLYLQNQDGLVHIEKAGVRTWIQANLAGAIPALRAVGEVDLPYAGARVSIALVREVMRGHPDAWINHPDPLAAKAVRIAQEATRRARIDTAVRVDPDTTVRPVIQAAINDRTHPDTYEEVRIQAEILLRVRAERAAGADPVTGL